MYQVLAIIDYFNSTSEIPRIQIARLRLLGGVQEEWDGDWGIAWGLGILGDKLDKAECHQFSKKKYYQSTSSIPSRT